MAPAQKKVLDKPALVNGRMTGVEVILVANSVNKKILESLFTLKAESPQLFESQVAQVLQEAKSHQDVYRLMDDLHRVSAALSEKGVEIYGGGSMIFVLPNTGPASAENYFLNGKPKPQRFNYLPIMVSPLVAYGRRDEPLSASTVHLGGKTYLLALSYSSKYAALFPVPASELRSINVCFAVPHTLNLSGINLGSEDFGISPALDIIERYDLREEITKEIKRRKNVEVANCQVVEIVYSESHLTVLQNLPRGIHQWAEPTYFGIPIRNPVNKPSEGTRLVDAKDEGTIALTVKNILHIQDVILNTHIFDRLWAYFVGPQATAETEADLR